MDMNSFWPLGQAPVPYEALALLVSGWDRAVTEKRSLWDFASGLSSLADAGLNGTYLRKLGELGLIGHRHEGRPPTKANRKALSALAARFGPRSRFVLTVRGARWVAGLFQQAKARSWANLFPTLPSPDEPLKLYWHEKARELSFAGLLVKAFRQKASNQIPLVRAFHDARWEKVIDLPPALASAEDPGEALHSALRRLHLYQVNPFLCFRGTGTGSRIRWEPSVPA